MRQALPVGDPKFIVSTIACGELRNYVGEIDMTILDSVVDIAGQNAISTRSQKSLLEGLLEPQKHIQLGKRAR